MAAYIIGTMSISDPDLYVKYRAGVDEATQKYGGRFLVRGGAVETLEGAPFQKRLVVLEFTSMQTLHEFWNSPEYEALKEIRRNASEADIWAVQGT
jgi:uncharacterized protein (DUF1330 family)